MLLSDVCLSVAYIRPNSRTERSRKTKIGTEVAQGHTWLGHHFQGQKVNSQLVADVLSSQHVGRGATWRINTTILLCRNSTAILRIQCEDIVNLQWADAYCVVMRTASNCYYYFLCPPAQSRGRENYKQSVKLRLQRLLIRCSWCWGRRSRSPLQGNGQALKQKHCFCDVTMSKLSSPTLTVKKQSRAC